jgi:hypothetical protein
LASEVEHLLLLRDTLKLARPFLNGRSITMRALHYAAVAATICLATQVRAQEIKHDTGLVCDTAEQVEAVMAAYDKSDNWQASLVAVNAEKVVCAVVSVAFIQGDKIKELHTKLGTLDEVEITVVGAITSGGIRPIKPEKQVTLFKPKGQDT